MVVFPEAEPDALASFKLSSWPVWPWSFLVRFSGYSKFGLVGFPTSFQSSDSIIKRPEARNYPWSGTCVGASDNSGPKGACGLSTRCGGSGVEDAGRTAYCLWRVVPFDLSLLRITQDWPKEPSAVARPTVRLRCRQPSRHQGSEIGFRPARSARFRRRWYSPAMLAEPGGVAAVMRRLVGRLESLADRPLAATRFWRHWCVGAALMLALLPATVALTAGGLWCWPWLLSMASAALCDGLPREEP